MKHKSTSSRTKTSSRKPLKKNMMGLTMEIEKEFFSLPARMVALCRSEQLKNQQHQTRLKTGLKNAEAKYRTSIKKLATLKKSKKKTPQKQMYAAQKSVTAANHLITEFKREISQAQKSTDAIMKKQTRFARLAKELPLLRRNMAKADIKSPKAPVHRKKHSSSIKSQPSAQDKIQPDYQTNLPTFSTRSDSTDLS